MRATRGSELGQGPQFFQVAPLLRYVEGGTPPLRRGRDPGHYCSGVRAAVFACSCCVGCIKQAIHINGFWYVVGRSLVLAPWCSCAQLTFFILTSSLTHGESVCAVGVCSE